MTQPVPSRRTVLGGAFGLGALGAGAFNAEPAAAAVGDVTLPETPTRIFYLKVVGPLVEGPSTERGFERLIPVETWGWGAGVPGGAPGGRVEPQELVVAAYTDVHSPRLSQSLHAGRTHSSMTLICRQPGAAGAPSATFLTLQFGNALVVDYSVTPHPVNGRPLDVFRIVMTRIAQIFTPVLPNGSTGTPVSMVFDYATGSATPPA